MWFRSFGSKSKPIAPEDDEYLVKRALFGPSELSPEIKARARQNASIALDAIEFRRPWTIETFVMQVSIDRARPVIVMDNNLLVGATRTTGFWRPTSTADYIHVSADVSEQAKEFIILHELGHILCGHPRPAVSGPDHPPMKKFAYDEYPTVPASLIDELNGATRDMHQANPCTYSVLEIEAEWFALLASDRADSYRRPTVASNAPRRTQEILDYYQRGLGW